MANVSAMVDGQILDIEFNDYLVIARDLMKEMRLAEDRQVCEKYIRSCLSMKDSDQMKVKFHRNRFFRYLLKTMRKTVDTQGDFFVNLPEGVEMEGQDMSQFSPDNKSYIAAKIIPGFGTLIYMACTDKPELGWDENGFANFSGISDIPNLRMMNLQDTVREPEATVMTESQEDQSIQNQTGP